MNKYYFFTVLAVWCLFMSTNSVQAQEINTELIKIQRNNSEALSNYYDSSLAPFYHGVASGDPLQDAVIIWTRVTTNSLSVQGFWKVSTTPDMNSVVSQGQFTTNQSKDYTVKVDVTGLQPFTTYYYQFEAEGKNSIIGRTRTAPAKTAMVDNLRFAIVSCSNYQGGYFNAYNQITKRSDIDAVIHLGDYIYEYETGGYGDNSLTDRGHVPNNETITLDDYRVRHSYYKLDPMLRNVHRQHPFITIWDDHEFANDANQFGAENHQPATEGDWQTRKNNAYKAYFEWMPIRANSIEEYRLYRKISYGNLVDLIMLDTRIEGRDTQVDSSKDLISKAAKNKVFKDLVNKTIAGKNLNNPDELKEVLRTVLPFVININDNSKQENSITTKEFEELINRFSELVITKKSLDNQKETERLQYLLSKGNKYNNETLADANKAVYKSILGQDQFNWLTATLQASESKWKIIANQVMMMPWNGVPTNDAWDGYDTERNRLLSFIKNNDIDNVVVLTGDIHSTFAGEVRYNGTCEACEFVVPSVTSTNLDFLGGAISGISEFYVRLLNWHMKDVDLDNHGYYILDVRENRVQADWYDTEVIDRPYDQERRSRGWYVNADNCRLYKARSAAVATQSRRTEDLASVNTPLATVEDLLILGVYPIPVSDKGNIHYIANTDTRVRIALYDTNGRLVSILQDEQLVKGMYNLSFEVNTLSTGSYIMTIESNGTKATRNILIQR
ncbi:alkaline phosphatase D family protein [Aquimarina brevivitae]|uniref:Putative secreted protein (Por secretion system target) n=1 Tax=Aquimarina brevivitae TaxID=323412 RepID=A0A4Q7NU70_9FLAO|nr:alkaline phosphatase D family protein [Aquimarina brevivitae]RZS90743.1 putative secreted protein (Por secretion system target) [Aquimarina brevivitae]